MRPISFAVERELSGSFARAGVLKTPHGEIKTPTFTAVATKANVKGVEAARLPELGVQTIIANTYHLYLSPGEKTVEKAGGVGQFMQFAGPTMTDSGGFQVFSLGAGLGKKIGKIAPASRQNFSASPSLRELRREKIFDDLPSICERNVTPSSFIFPLLKALFKSLYTFLQEPIVFRIHMTSFLFFLISCITFSARFSSDISFDIK
jgi:tRNA-guanine family transglycosylase